MGTKDKIVEKFTRGASQITWDELRYILVNVLGFIGETNDGSRYKFFHQKKGLVLDLHCPHPEKEISSNTRSKVRNYLKRNGLLK